MAATKAQITEWLTDALLGGARWVVIKCDTLDSEYPLGACCYPVVLNRAEEVHKVVGNSDATQEVYDLTLPIEEQLAESRAWHLPKEE